MKQKRHVSEAVRAHCTRISHGQNRLGDRLRRGEPEAFEEVRQAIRDANGSMTRMAENMGIAARTPYRWLELFPELRDEQLSVLSGNPRDDLRRAIENIPKSDDLQLRHDGDRWCATCDNRTVRDTDPYHALALVFGVVPLSAHKRAAAAVSAALKRGRLKTGPCQMAGDDCDGPIEAHHHNGYEQQHRLDVIWLCNGHHRAEHRRLNGCAKSA